MPNARSFVLVLKCQIVFLQISRLTWYTRFDPVKKAEEVATTDLYTIDTQYTKEMERDAREAKDGILFKAVLYMSTPTKRVHLSMLLVYLK